LSHQQRSAEFSRDQFRTCTRYRYSTTVMFEGEEEVLPEWPIDRLDRFSYQRTELTFPHFNRYNDHDKYCLARSITYHKVCC